MVLRRKPKPVELHDTTNLQLVLAVAGGKTTISVSLRAPDTDPVYRQLRDIGLGETYRIEGFTMPSMPQPFSLPQVH